MLVTKRFEFSYAHILPNHDGKCRRLHGHNAILEVTVEGEPRIAVEHNTIMSSSEGMVIDFSKLKTIVKAAVIDQWDHRFLAMGDEWTYRLAFTVNRGNVSGVPDDKDLEDQFVAVGVRTTAENLAHLAFEKIYGVITDRNLTLQAVKFYETPDSWAEYSLYDYQSDKNKKYDKFLGLKGETE